MRLFKHPATTAAAGTVLLWASAFPAISVAVRALGPVGLSVARLTVASVTLALACPFMTMHRPRARDLPLIALCGLAGMTAYQLLLNTGERVVPAGTASLLVATTPIYASLLAACFLGERPTRRRWAGSAVALAGTALIAAAHGLGFGAAALVVLAAAMVQAVFHTAQKPLLRRYSGFEVTVYAMWAGTIFILPWSGSLLRALPHASASAIGSAVFLGVAPSAVGFVLWAYAMARMDVGRVTVCLYLVPAAAILISLVWLSQIPGPVELAGGAVALAGVILASSRSRNARPEGDQQSRPEVRRKLARNVSSVEPRLPKIVVRPCTRNTAQVKSRTVVAPVPVCSIPAVTELRAVFLVERAHEGLVKPWHSSPRRPPEFAGAAAASTSAQRISARTDQTRLVSRR